MLIDEFEFLNRYQANELVLGPIQRSEAIAIYGLLKTIRPLRVVEIGFGEGDSTEALLAGIRDIPGASVTSYDIKVSYPHVNALSDKYGNFNFILADQGTLVINEPIDFLFLDASHDLNLNKSFWENNEHLLGLSAFVVIHDTGIWADGLFDDTFMEGFGKRGQLRGVTGRVHQPDEVDFVAWLTKERGWTRIDIGSKNCFRHGFTILQRIV